MLRILVVITALIAVAAAAAGISARQSPFGLVGGISDCGSSGKLGDVWLTNCTQTPCHLDPYEIYDIAIRFTAEATSSDLALLVYHDESVDLLFEQKIDGEIQGGLEYELTLKLTVTDEYAGTYFFIRFYIYDLVAQKAEICAMAALTIGK